MNKKLIIIISGLVITIILLVLLIIGINKTSNKTDSDQNPSDNQVDVDKPDTNNEEEIITGIFKQQTDVTASILNLNEDMSFKMGINLCEAIADIVGTYEVKDNIITLTFEKEQYIGFDGDTNTEYQFEIVDNNNLKFISYNVACGPFQNEIYKRQS